MARENSGLIDYEIEQARLFFSSLMKETSGGPLEDALVVLDRIQKVGDHVRRLAELGDEDTDNGVSATYERLSKGAVISLKEDKGISSTEFTAAQRALFKYSVNGFSRKNLPISLQWAYDNELLPLGNPKEVSVPTGLNTVFADLGGQIGMISEEEEEVYWLADNTAPYIGDKFAPEPDRSYARGLIVISNTVSRFFASQNPIRLLDD
jgi:hypothetical protein